MTDTPPPNDPYFIPPRRGPKPGTTAKPRKHASELSKYPLTQAYHRRRQKLHPVQAAIERAAVADRAAVRYHLLKLKKTVEYQNATEEEKEAMKQRRKAEVMKKRSQNGVTAAALKVSNEERARKVEEEEMEKQQGSSSPSSYNTITPTILTTIIQPNTITTNRKENENPNPNENENPNTQPNIGKIHFRYNTDGDGDGDRKSLLRIELSLAMPIPEGNSSAVLKLVNWTETAKDDGGGMVRGEKGEEEEREKDGETVVKVEADLVV
ncbi:hypothetical protein FQN50_008839 [Emmonsiellopsis sp. PD_5]|nr:hypothetical protein FQN50_008839 [Emmonsiellopsis sp. PD_5]